MNVLVTVTALIEKTPHHMTRHRLEPGTHLLVLIYSHRALLPSYLTHLFSHVTNILCRLMYLALNCVYTHITIQA